MQGICTLQTKCEIGERGIQRVNLQFKALRDLSWVGQILTSLSQCNHIRCIYTSASPNKKQSVRLSKPIIQTNLQFRSSLLKQLEKLPAPPKDNHRKAYKKKKSFFLSSAFYIQDNSFLYPIIIQLPTILSQGDS